MAVIEKDVVRKITWRLMPLLCLLYLIAYIDRQNVSYAKLQMVSALNLSEAAFGLGASLFFIGYFLCEIPANLLLTRFGAKVWFTRIIVSWGCVTIALAFTSSPTMFYILRFLLGAFEAGFFPGVVYLMGVWFPRDYRARMIGLLFIFAALANAIGAPIGGSLLDLNGTLGLAGWEWVFLATGIPAVLSGILTFCFLEDSPEKSRFLTSQEKDWLRQRIASEQTGMSAHADSALKALCNPMVLFLALCFLGTQLAAYGLGYWLPTIVKSFGVSNTLNGWINLVPWLCAVAALCVIPRAADRSKNKMPFIVLPALVGAASLMLSTIAATPFYQMICLCFAAAGILSGLPVFWTLPNRFLKGAGAAAGIAAINSIGNLGGFVAQNAVPMVRDLTGSVIAPMLLLASCLALVAVVIFVAWKVIPDPSVSGPESV